MKWYENRALAWVALALCVAVSVVGLGGMYLSRTREHALRVFTDGADPSQPVRHSMDAYLDHAAEAAQIMASEAALHLGDSQLARDAGDEAAELARDENGPAARYSTYAQLKGHVEQLYNDMYTAVGSDEFHNFKLAYDDFWGDDDLIRRDPYPALARSYNRLIAGFPASVAAALTGGGALETFGG